jgi:carbon-monoxide dehydrogenase medium subunit
MFTDAERLIADPLVRNRGTIGGALCQADPAEDLSSVVAALHGRAVIRGRSGDREVPMRDFHVGPYETVVGDGEMLVEVRVPLHDSAGSAYEKVKRRAGDWAVAAAGALLWMDGGRIAGAGVGLTAVGGGVTSERAEQALVGQMPSTELFDRAAALAAEDCNPVSDQRGSVEYKRHLAGELTRRALRRAVARARGQEA